MRIRADTVETHRFTPVRRRGYDPAEVDAVMGRVAAALRDYEALTADLETKLQEADASSVAMRRMLASAQRTYDEMIAEAHAEADATRVEAAAEVERSLAAAREAADRAEEEATAARAAAAELLEAAESESAALRTEAEEMLIAAKTEAESANEGAARTLQDARSRAATTVEGAREEAGRLDSESEARAEAVVADAERTAEAILATARQEAESLISSAVGEARQLRATVVDEAEELRSTRAAAAQELLVDAEQQAGELLERARTEAEEATHDARGERIGLEQRVAKLRAAVSDAERGLQRLAATATAHLGAIEEGLGFEAGLFEPPLASTSTSYAAAAIAEERVTMTLPTSPPEVREPHPTTPPLPGMEADEAFGSSNGAGADAVDAGAEESEPAATGSEALDEEAAGDELADVPSAEAVAALVAGRDHAIAEPDGSGRLPAERATVTPTGSGREAEPTVTDRTIYQRTGSSLRRRLKARGQDPAQRGR